MIASGSSSSLAGRPKRCTARIAIGREVASTFLVAGTDAEREQRQMQRSGPRRHGHGVLDLARAGELGLELGDLRAHRQVARIEHVRDLRQLVGPDVGAR